MSMMGAFALVVGFFLIVSGVTQHLMYSESAIVSKPPSTSRMPPSDCHEKMSFIYAYQRGPDYDGPHYVSQSRDIEEEAEEETIVNREYQ